MMTAQQTELFDFEEMYIKKLEQFVNQIVSTMATSVNLQPREALDILECIQVEMLDELQNKVNALEDDIHNEPVRRVGSIKLSWEIEKAIKAISFATDLNTEEVTTILSKKPGASLADVSYRLHKQSAHDRVSF